VIGSGMRRLLLGIFAILFLTAGIVGLAVYGTGDSDVSAAASVAVRAGALLAALWLALPQLTELLNRFPPWMIGAMSVCALVVVVRPRLLIYLLPLLGALLVLRFFGWLLKPLPTPPPAKKRTSERTVPPRQPIKEQGR